MSTRTRLHTNKEPFPGYRLGQLLGQGAFGQVWQAARPDGQEVALKFVPAENWARLGPEIRAIQSVQQLRHPALIRIDNVWSYRGYVVIAMELAEASLQDMLDAYPSEFGTAIPAPEVCTLLAQAAAGIDFLNARQHILNGQRVALQHCDIKPGNLLLFGKTVKLSDFGLTSPMTGVLKEHRRAGTPAYAAPEVFQGRLSDRTDQYALAVTYCQLRGSCLPFADTPTSLVRSYVRPAPELSMLARMERPVVRRALASSPADRWPSCGAFMAELARAVI